MENNKDWKELEKWQKDQDNIKGNQEKVYKEFDKKNVRNASIFSALFRLMTKSLFSILVSILIIAGLIGIFYFYSSVKRYLPIDVESTLSDRYRGEQFEIIEKDVDDKGKGIYIVSPKKNKNITFKAYKNKGNSLYDEYSAKRLKYYFENCEDKNLVADFEVEEKMKKIDDVELLEYSIRTQINNYTQIEEKVNKAYKLVNYLKSKDDKLYEAIGIFNWNLGYYYSVQIDINRKLETEIYRAKYEFIDSMKKNNKTQELAKLGNEEVNKIWKPKQLELIINGKQMKLLNEGTAYVFYFQDNQDYEMSGVNTYLNQIEQIEILDKNVISGYITKIKYHGKEYRVEHSSSEEEPNKNVIRTVGSLENFLYNFEHDIIYDYENQKVYVTIR